MKTVNSNRTLTHIQENLNDNRDSLLRIEFREQLNNVTTELQEEIKRLKKGNMKQDQNQMQRREVELQGACGSSNVQPDIRVYGVDTETENIPLEKRDTVILNNTSRLDSILQSSLALVLLGLEKR